MVCREFFENKLDKGTYEHFIYQVLQNKGKIKQRDLWINKNYYLTEGKVSNQKKDNL